MRAFRKLAATLFLFVLLMPLPASAARSKSRSNHNSTSAKRAPLDLCGRVWALALGVWTKEGLGIDPDGRSGPAPVSTTRTDEGIDPSGSSGQ